MSAEPGLRLPIGCGELRLERLPDDTVLARWTDCLLRQVVEVEATLEDLVEWERIGGVPESLTPRREWLDDAIEETQARLRDLHEWSEAMVNCWPELKSQGRG